MAEREVRSHRLIGDHLRMSVSTFRLTKKGLPEREALSILQEVIYKNVVYVIELHRGERMARNIPIKIARAEKDMTQTELAAVGIFC